MNERTIAGIVKGQRRFRRGADPGPLLGRGQPEGHREPLRGRRWPPRGATPVLLQQAPLPEPGDLLRARESCFDARYFSLFSQFDAVLDVFAYQPVVLGYELEEEAMARYRRYMAQLFRRLGGLPALHPDPHPHGSQRPRSPAWNRRTTCDVWSRPTTWTTTPSAPPASGRRPASPGPPGWPSAPGTPASCSWTSAAAAG